MSERKVLNKYFPPDFDPSKVPRRKHKFAADPLHTVRLMTPFSMCCNTCGEYIYKRTKFNARKETVKGEDYLGIKIFRFYIKCPRCAAEITFKTDPKNTDYIAEHGAQRNFEPWRDEKLIQEEIDQSKTIDEEMNPMKALENRTIESRREMEILDALDEIRTVNARTERVNTDSVIQRIVETRSKEEQAAIDAIEQEDDALAKAIFQSADGNMPVKRLLEEEEPTTIHSKPPINIPSFNTVFSRSTDPLANINKPQQKLAGVIIKKKPKPNSAEPVTESQ